MKPLKNTTEDQTLKLMDMWIKGHKMDAAREYGKMSNPLCNPINENTKIFSNYNALNDYFKSI